MPTPVGTEVHSVRVAVCESAGSQPMPRPLARVVAAKAAAAPATTPAHARRRATRRTAKGTVTSAVTLTAAARPRSTPAGTPQRAPFASASPATISPASSASLCAPDTPCRSTSGLAANSQASTRGSPPSRRPAHSARTNPASATRRRTAIAVHSPPVAAAAPASASHIGPYGVGVCRQIGGTRSSHGHGRSATPCWYGLSPWVTSVPWQAYETASPLNSGGATSSGRAQSAAVTSSHRTSVTRRSPYHAPTSTATPASPIGRYPATATIAEPASPASRSVVGVTRRVTCRAAACQPPPGRADCAEAGKGGFLDANSSTDFDPAWPSPAAGPVACGSSVTPDTVP
jgi:hypothetical protein